MTQEQRFTQYFEKLLVVLEFYRKDLFTELKNVDIVAFVIELLQLWSPESESLHVIFPPFTSILTE